MTRKIMNTKMHPDELNETYRPKLNWTDHSPRGRRANEAEKSNHLPRLSRPLALMSLAFVLGLAAGCGGGKAQTKNTDFFTSGSREADQRASQRMAKEEQLSGTGEGAGEKDVKKATPAAQGKAEAAKAAQ